MHYQKDCPVCGQKLDQVATTCVYCSARQPGILKDRISPNNRLACALLCFFLGYFGIHRFYTRKIATGILLLLTGGGFGIWWIIDLVLILIGSFRDKEGRLILNW